MRRLPPVVLTLPLLVAGCTVEDSDGPPPYNPPIPAATNEPVGEAPPKTAARPAVKETADSLVAKGIKAEESDDLPAAAGFFDRAVEADPTHREALYHSAKTGQELASKFARPHNSKILLKSAAAARKLHETYKTLNENEQRVLQTALFNEACTLVQNGDLTRAVQVLGEAHEAGFDDLAHLDLDNELDPIRKMPEFRKITAAMDREYAAKLVAAAKPFPFDFQLPGLDNKTVSLADLKGKVVIVDFWGTWCAPCRKEIPHFVALLKKYRDQGLEVVGLNYENVDGAAAKNVIGAFVKEVGIPYPCLIGDRTTMNQIADFEGFPTTLFIDRQGKVRLKVTGYQPLGVLEAIITPLLGAAPAKEGPKDGGTNGPAAKDAPAKSE